MRDKRVAILCAGRGMAPAAFDRFRAPRYAATGRTASTHSFSTLTTQRRTSPPVDRVFIEGLEIEALIGIYDWERRIRQPLLFDVEMEFNNRIPAASDAINARHPTLQRRIIISL